MTSAFTVEIDRDWGGYTVYGWNRMNEPTDWSLIGYRTVLASLHDALEYGRRIVGRGKPIMKPVNGRWVRVGYAGKAATA